MGAYHRARKTWKEKGVMGKGRAGQTLAWTVAARW